MKRRLSGAFAYALYALFALAYGYTFFNVCLASPHYRYHIAVLLPLAFALAGGLAVALRALRGRMAFFVSHDTAVAWGVTLVCFLLRAALSIPLEFTPDGDLECAFQGARAWLVNGSFAVVDMYKAYFMRYPNTWGLLAFLFGVLRAGDFFGVSEAGQFFFFAAVNSALVGASGLLLWALVRRRATKKAALLALLLFTTLPPVMLCGPVFYSDTTSMPFLIGTLFLSDRARSAKSPGRRAFWAAAMGLCAAVGGLIKATVFIAWIAALIDWLLHERPRRFLAVMAVSGFCAALVTAGFSSWIFSRHLDRAQTARERLPLSYWLYMGIPSDAADGEYTDWLYEYTVQLPPEQRDGEMRERIGKSIQNAAGQGLLPAYFSRKNDTVFGDGTFTLSPFLSLHPRRHTFLSQIVFEQGRYYPIYRHICMALYACVMLWALVYAVRQLGRRMSGPRLDACVVTLAGAFVFLMCWEAKGRYFFHFVPVLCALAGCGAAEWISTSSLRPRLLNRLKTGAEASGNC